MVEDVCVCEYSDGCIQEKGRASATGNGESHLGTPDLVLGARHSGRKKEEKERGKKGEGGKGGDREGWCALQGRATLKGREKVGGG